MVILMSRRNRKIVKTLIIFNIIIIVLVSIIIKNELLIKKDYKKIIEKNEKNNNKNLKKYDNVVFLGDSITEIYPIEEIYTNIPAVRSGVSGYGARDILDRLNKMVYVYNPKKVFLLIGTNDIASDPSIEKQNATIKIIKKIIIEIRKNRPETKIYVESIYPVNNNMDKNMVAKRTNEIIKSMNKKIKKYCNENSITYINVYDELLDENGYFYEKLTYDGLHPSEIGYAKITRILYPYVYE